MDPDLRSRLEQSAKQRGRSLHAEIVARLDAEPADQSPLVEAIARLNVVLAQAQCDIEAYKVQLAEQAAKYRAAVRLLKRTHYDADLERELLAAELEESPAERDILVPGREAIWAALKKWNEAQEQLEAIRIQQPPAT